MANCTIIMGASGTGKSTSIKTLNPDETVVINVLGKRLPFKGSQSMYSKEKGNLVQMDDYNQIIQSLQSLNAGINQALQPANPQTPLSPEAAKANEKLRNIKNIIIEDSGYITRKEYFRRAKENGFNRFTEMAQHFQGIIETCEKMKDDLNVFFIMHCEEVVSDGIIVGYQVATVGKLLLSQYNPVECVPMVLFSTVRYDDKGTPEYGFYTHRCKVGSVEIPAKSPDGMFDANFIPNDLGMVVKAMNEYYQ